MDPWAFSICMSVLLSCATFLFISIGIGWWQAKRDEKPFDLLPIHLFFFLFCWSLGTQIENRISGDCSTGPIEYNSFSFLIFFFFQILKIVRHFEHVSYCYSSFIFTTCYSHSKTTYCLVCVSPWPSPSPVAQCQKQRSHSKLLIDFNGQIIGFQPVSALEFRFCQFSSILRIDLVTAT